MDHDQRFKMLIKEFFAEFLRLFFAAWAERFDLAAAEWLDKEIFADPPSGRRRVLDLVAKLPLRQAVAGARQGEPEHWLALVHIEIEWPDTIAPARPRMFDAYAQLRRQYGLPVLPIGMFLRVGLNGIGTDVYEEKFWELQTIRFEYLYVGLPALDAIEYVQGENWLGVALAALMRIPPDRAAWLGAEALRRITVAPITEQQRFLLAECVQAYLPLDEAQRQEFAKIVSGETYEGVQAMNMTWYDKGIEKGIEKGQRLMLRGYLEDHFGPLSPVAVRRLEETSFEQLQPLLKAAWKAKSLADLGLAD